MIPGFQTVHDFAVFRRNANLTTVRIRAAPQEDAAAPDRPRPQRARVALPRAPDRRGADGVPRALRGSAAAGRAAAGAATGAAAAAPRRARATREGARAHQVR